MITTLYRGSVKNVLGPVRVQSADGSGSFHAVLFEYSDAYSVFDWGRMPDALPGKGAALAMLAAHWFEQLESAETWKEFSRAPEAFRLRKANRFGAAFNEIGERLQEGGLRTHYLGLARPPGPAGLVTVSTAECAEALRHLVARQVSVVKPRFEKVMGQAVADYFETRGAPAPRLVPLEVVFRFGFPAGSSILERAARDPRYLEGLGFGGLAAEPGVSLDFPVLEMFTKLEPSDRPVSLGEALAISGLSGAQLQEMLLRTAWVAGWLRSACARAGLELADGKLEWALTETGELMLVDAIGPDELRLLARGSHDLQLSKEFLRAFYRATPWHAAVQAAKVRAAREGVADWKRLAPEVPPALPPEYREAVSHLYPALTNALTGRRWFPQAWGLPELAERLRALSARAAETAGEHGGTGAEAGA